MAKSRITPVEAQVSRTVLAAFEDIRDSIRELQTTNARSIVLRYDVGLRLARFRAKPESYETNLKAMSQLLQRELNYQLAPQVLDSFVNLAQTFPDADQFRKLAAQPMRNGDLLTWSHLRALLPLGPQRAALRDELIQQCLEHSWGYRELARAVKAALKPRKPGQGRKPRAPGSPMTAVQQMVEMLRAIMNRGPSWENVLGDSLREAPDSQITPRLVSECEVLVQLLDDSRQLLRRIHRLLQDALPSFRSVLEQRESAAAPRQPRTPANRLSGFWDKNGGATAKSSSDDDGEENGPIVAAPSAGSKSARSRG